MLKQVSLLAARQGWVRKLVISTPGVRDLAWRFVAGEDLDAGVQVLETLGRRGILGSLNHVGTHVHSAAEATAAADQVIEAIRRIRTEGLDANVSVKLTQIGLDVDDAFCRSELRRVLDAADRNDLFVRIDMEESGYVQGTISIFEEMREAYGTARVGIVLQSYLRNRGEDLARLVASGSRIRIVKGGYWEEPGIVYRNKADVDAAFVRDIRLLLERSVSPAIATHDPTVIAETRRIADKLGLARGSFEFQMLYGVRVDLQEKLIRDGFRVRLYVPYGGDWFVYFLGCIRRLPAGLFRRIGTRVGRRHRQAR